MLEKQKENIVKTLEDIVNNIKNGSITKYEIIQNGNGITNISINRNKDTSTTSLGFPFPMFQGVAMVACTSVPPIKNKLSKKDRQEKVLDLHQKGFSQHKIAKELMCSQKTVSNDIKELKEKRTD